MTDADLVELAGEDGLEALRAIADAEQAWSPWFQVACGREGVLERLEAEGLVLVTRWKRPDYLAVTLTPFAASAMGLALIERGGPAQVPKWVSTHYAEFLENQPVKAERHFRHVPLLFPELLVDHRKPEPVIDDVTEEPMVLFQGPAEEEGKPRTGGITVVVDPRLGKGKSKKRRGRKAG